MCALTQRREAKTQSVFPGALGASLGFSALYTAQLRENFARKGTQGRLHLHAPRHRILFLAKAPTYRNSIWLPLSWSLGRRARDLYWAHKNVGLMRCEPRQH